MPSLKDTKFRKFHPDTLQSVRKLYGLDGPGAMDDAIDVLEEWVKKQDHFLKKDYERDYLENLIIRAKGSIERAKQRLDHMCTARTLMTKYFGNWDVTEFPLDDLQDTLLPRLTHDHYRVYILRNVGKKFEDDFCTNYFKRFVFTMEYDLKIDYSAGIIAIFDYRETNLLALIKNLSLLETQQVISMIMEGYGYRVKAIHMLSSSKLIETMIGIFKQFLSAKIGSRIQVHSTLESLHEHLEKDILPVEYGGSEMPLSEVFKLCQEIQRSDEAKKYVWMMNGAGTNEAYRSAEKYNEQVLGMPGSFRVLRVD